MCGAAVVQARPKQGGDDVDQRQATSSTDLSLAQLEFPIRVSERRVTYPRIRREFIHYWLHGNLLKSRVDCEWEIGVRFRRTRQIGRSRVTDEAQRHSAVQEPTERERRISNTTTMMIKMKQTKIK